MAYEFHDTSHLEHRALERGFTVEEAKLAIGEPEQIEKTPVRRGNHGGMLWLFSRKFGARVLVVVAEVKRHEC